MRRAFATLAAAAAVAGVPIMFSSTASAGPGLCTDIQRCMTCIRVQSYGNCASPPSDTPAPQSPQVASNDDNIPGDTQRPAAISPLNPVISPMPEQPNDIPYDKPGGSPLNPVYPRQRDPNELHIPPA